MKFFLLLLGVFGLIASANAQYEAEGNEAHIPHGPQHSHTISECVWASLDCKTQYSTSMYAMPIN